MTVLQAPVSPSRWRVPPWIGFALGAAGCVVVAGIAVGEGGTTRDAALALGVVVIVAPIAWIAVRPRLGVHALAVEIPLVLLLLSTLVWRIRDAEALATNPVDTAGGYRLACVALAGLLGAFAITKGTAHAVRVLTLPFGLYCAYVVIVFAGAPLSVDPLLTAYRGVELATGAVVIAGAFRTVGREAGRRIMSVLYWWFVALIASVWAGALLFPGEALNHLERSPLPWQISGVLPAVSSNGVGTAAVVLGVWSFALLFSRREQPAPRRWFLLAAVPVSLATLVFAQYRTGYVAFVVGMLTVLLLRRRGVAAWVIVAGLLVAATWGAVVLERAQPVVLRGVSLDEAARLSSRIQWWSDALPIWRESPLIGKGLLTATRFEVLAEIGRTKTSTIHGTWIEVLVGTGIIGLALLAVAVLTITWRAFVEAVRPGGRLVPITLMVLVLIRSITGSTIEVFGAPYLLALTLAVWIPHRSLLDATGRSEPAGVT